MSEELLKRGLVQNPEKIGKWDFYNIGETNIKSLKDSQILNPISTPHLDRRKPDGIIVDKGKLVALISNKLPARLKRDKEVQDWIEVTKGLGSRLLIVCDGNTRTFWINALTGDTIKDEQGHDLKKHFDPRDEEVPALIERILESIDENNSSLIKPEHKDPTSLAKSVWQDIWSAAGDDPENCLYTFVELFIFKYLSDLEILKGMYSFEELLKKYEANKPEEVLEYYADIVRKEIKKQFKENPVDRTTIINGSTFINKQGEAVKGYSTVFKKVLKQFKEYEKRNGKFSHIHREFKSKIFETFLKESISKKNWGQYFTPLKVVRAIAKMAASEIRDGITVCDPACGVGKFLLEIIADDPKRFFRFEKGKLKSTINLVGYDKGFADKEQKTIILAKANMLIYLWELLRENPSACEQFSILFNDTFKLITQTTLGTLSVTEADKYDLILTNPPYVVSGNSNIKAEIKASGLQHYYPVGALGIEGLFLQWIIKALKPGGKAFVVVPDGILNRSTDKDLRRHVLEECFVDAIISLPQKTFFTTIKKTYILAITKKRTRGTIQTDPVFTYIASEIGETLDINRFEIPENHLETATSLFNAFKYEKSHFAISDPRCKVQPIEKFDPDVHWSIDRWWSEQELIDLGIRSEDDRVSVETFTNFLSEVSDGILEFQEPLRDFAEKKTPEDGFYKTVKLGDPELFNLFIGKRLLKRDYKDIRGTIPAYSANVFQPVAHLTHSNISDFSLPSILWGIDGDFNFNNIGSDTPFATTDHCGVIQIKADRILPTYLLHQLNEIKTALGFDRELRSSLGNMRQVEVRIPIDKSGEFDVSAQRMIATASSAVGDLKSKVTEYRKQLKKLKVEVEPSGEFREVLIGDILDSPPTNSGLKRKDVSAQESRQTPIPVYSATMNEHLVFGWVSNASKWKKYEDLLTWNKDGSSGYVFYRKDTFVPYEKVKLLKIKDRYVGTLSYEYLKHAIQARLIKENFGFGNKCSMEKVLKLTIQVPSRNGDFDLEAQNQIAQKYTQLDEIKSSVVQELDKISRIRVALE